MTYFLSLGANLGEREHTIRRALDCIEKRIGTVTRCSSFFYSEPWGFDSTHPFCNLCCILQTDKQPMEVLHATQTIEHELGRTHKTVSAYSDRTIDIDLIRAFDNDGKEIKVQTDAPDSARGNRSSLILPHPLWRERPFVVVPLTEIGGTFI